MMFPISISLLVEKIKTKELLKIKVLIIIITFLISSILLTNSRNAWIGFFLTIPFIFGKKSLKWYLPFILFLTSLISSSFLPFLPIWVKDFSQNLIPLNVQNRISELTFSLDSFPRIKIWSNAISFIIEKPLFGWGAGTFPYLNRIKTGVWNDHTHNLFLELSISYGLIVSILIFSIFLTILIKSFFSIFISNKRVSIIDRGWWAAGLIFFFTHLTDVLIYDIRINLASWIFLAGLKNTITNYSKNSIEL